MHDFFPEQSFDTITLTHYTQRELDFWNYHQKSVQIRLLEAATVSTGHYAFLRVGLIPVEPLLQPWQSRTDGLCEQVT
jgi:hypothetical protein